MCPLPWRKRKPNTTGAPHATSEELGLVMVRLDDHELVLHMWKSHTTKTDRSLHGFLNTWLKSVLLSALVPTCAVHFGSHTHIHGAQAHLRPLERPQNLFSCCRTDVVLLLQSCCCYQATKITGKTKTLQQLCDLKTDRQKVALVTTGHLNRNHVITVGRIISAEL